MQRYYSFDQVPDLARAILDNLPADPKKATVVGLKGELGAGKTSLVQSIAFELGVQENISSPTFVIAKFYQTNNDRWSDLIHIDAYRIEDQSEIEVLGWQGMTRRPNTLIIVEWPERIEKTMPEESIFFEIEHVDEGRKITQIKQ